MSNPIDHFATGQWSAYWALATASVVFMVGLVFWWFEDWDPESVVVILLIAVICGGIYPLAMIGAILFGGLGLILAAIGGGGMYLGHKLDRMRRVSKHNRATLKAARQEVDRALGHTPKVEVRRWQ